MSDMYEAALLEQLLAFLEFNPGYNYEWEKADHFYRVRIYCDTTRKMVDTFSVSHTRGLTGFTNYVGLRLHAVTKMLHKTDSPMVSPKVKIDSSIYLVNPNYGVF